MRNSYWSIRTRSFLRRAARQYRPGFYGVHEDWPSDTEGGRVRPSYKTLPMRYTKLKRALRLR